MKQRPIQPIKTVIIALLLSWLLLAASPTHAEVAAICNVGAASAQTAFELALADSSCATININAYVTITGSHTITRNLEIKGTVGNIDGGPAVIFDGQNNGRIFTIGADNLTITFNNLIFQNGNTTSLSGAAGYGGAIRNSWTNGTVTIKDSVVKNNQTEGWGGGIYNKNTLVVINSEFSQNDAQYGGAIYSDSGSLEVDHATFDNNTATASNSDNFGLGGAIYFRDGSSTITNSTFSQNQATGAVSNPNSGFGGGIYVELGTLNMDTTTFTNNSAPAGAGMMLLFATAAINTTTFSGNTGIQGAALNVQDARADVSNSTISGNDATANGTIYTVLTAAAEATDIVTLAHTTVVNNGGKGIYANGTDIGLTYTAVRLQNSIVAGHTADCDGPAIIDATLGYNLDSDGRCLSSGGTGNATVGDVGLNALADNGGPTPTHLPTLSSPARDQIPAGTNGCGTTYTDDQRGTSRPQLGLCDIGAVEVSCTEAGVAFPYTMSSGGETELNTALQCANVNGTADTITLTSDVTLTQISDSSLGNSGLVPITSEITLQGNGYTIGRDSSYSCDGSDPAFRHLLITASGDLTLNNLTLSNGCLLGSDATAYGGAIHNSGTLTLSQSQLTNSRAYVAGALWNGATGTATIEQSTISYNTAGSGGGIINSNNLLLRNSTVSNNTATSLQAGGIWNANGTLQLLYSTVAANTAPSRGGGILNSSTLILQGSLIADNNKDCENDATVTNNGDNFIEGTGGKACGIGNGGNGSIVGVDPKLGPLQDNGGATPTKALLAGSPAIDAVTGSGCPAVDQRGVARPQEGACDMGAYEAEAQVATTPTLTMSADGSYGWTPDQSGCTESLYRSATPYTGYAWLTDDPANYDGSGSLVSVETNYFYYLYVDCDSSTAQSDAVGEFTFAIVPGE